MMINTIWGVMDLEEYRKFMNLTDKEYERAKQQAQRDLEEAKLRAKYKELNDALYTYRIFYPNGKPGIDFDKLKTCEDYEEATEKVRSLIQEWYKEQEEKERRLRNKTTQNCSEEYSSLGFDAYKAQSIRESNEHLPHSYTYYKKQTDHMYDRW